MKLPNLLLATTAAAAIGASTAKAQVIISEIEFNTSEQWIELYNQSAIEFDLSAFSIYHATKTPFRINDYWFPIPTGTKIAPLDYIRIVWGTPVPSTNPEPRDIYTGDTNFHFLFGHGFEPLDPSQGAIGLCKTKLNSQMNNADIFADWIQWGDTNFKRGQTAVNSKLWESNTATIPVGPADYSLMVLYDERAKSSPPPLGAYQYDESPTKLGHNAFPLESADLGGACGFRLPAPLSLSSNAPYHGNASFTLTVTGTQGPAFFELLMFCFSASAQRVKPDVLSTIGIMGGDCSSLPNLLLVPIATSTQQTTIAAPLLDAALTQNKTLYLQAATLSGLPPQYHGYSNVLKLRTSN